MRPRSLLVLLLVVVGLGAFIWFFERDLPSTEERRSLGKRVLQVEAEEISAIEIETASGRVLLERVAAAGSEESEDSDVAVAEDGDGEASWRLIEPMSARADTAAVDSFLDLIVALERRRTLEEVDPAAVGLESPRATIELRGAGEDRVLRVGAEIPASSNMVLAIDDSVYAVGSQLWTRLDKPPGDWRDRDVLPFDRDRIDRIELSSAAEAAPIVLARRGQAFWVEAPVADMADKARVDELLGDLEGLRVERFIDDPEAEADLGLDPPRGTIELAVNGETDPFSLFLGAEKEGEAGRLYARAADQVFESGDELVASLQRRAAEWRSAMWSALEVYQIDSLTVRDEAGELEIQRAGADWLRGEEKIENTPVRDFIYALTSAAADGFLDAGRDSLGEPRLSIELVGGERRELLELFAEREDGVPATVGTRDAILLLPAATAEEVRLKLQEVRDAEPLPAEDSPLGEGGGA